MTWNPVPLMVQLQGAAHAPETFRNAIYASTGGAEGVNGPTDCKVTATTVPGGTVNIAIGSVLIVARQANVRQQTYSDANQTVDNVSVTSTGSSKRSDLIVVRIEDPGQAGETQYDPPANAAVGPYIFTRVIPNVPAGTTRLQDVAGHENDTGITLSRIDIPANTGTITNAMIVDLRKIARPRFEQVSLDDLGATTGTLTSTSGTLFPPYQPSVVVPDWATHMKVDMIASQLSAGASSNGLANVSVRGTDGSSVIIDGDQMAYNVDVLASAGVGTRFSHLASTVVGDIRAQRGKNVKPSSYMRKAADNRGNLTYDQYSQVRFVCSFFERII